MRPRWLLVGLSSLALSWYWQQRRRSDLQDLDERLAGQIDRLGQRETELEAQVEALRKQEAELAEHVDRLGEQEHALEAQVNGIGDREERLQREIEHLQRRELNLAETIEAQSDRIKELQQPAQAEPSAQWELMLPNKNFNILVRLAQQQLSGIQVHNKALQGGQRLGSSMEKNWLPDTWRALGSLHEYASSEHEYHGNFLAWTQNSQSKYAWHSSRIAMHESDVTMQQHGDTRVFPVDRKVDPSGMKEMQAHLKIQAKGSISPRVFFYDDTEGETGLVHIGFIGPHDLVPVASFK